jgi:hypothetical protein
MRTMLAVATIFVATSVVAMFADTTGQPDPAVGQFTGSLKVTGVLNNGQLKPAPNCGECHAQATMRLEQSQYVMDLQVKNSGNKKPEVVKLVGKAEDGKLTFKNDKYDVSLVDGKLVGKRAARMQGSISLVRVPTSQPASQPETATKNRPS